MNWTFQPAQSSFEALRSDWDAINRAQHDHILLDSGFIAPLVRHFGPQDLLLGANSSSDRPGMALVLKKKPGYWETFQPSQAPLGLFVAGSRSEAAGYFSDVMRSLPGVAVQFSVLQQDPDFSAFPPDLAGPNLEILDYIETGRLTIETGFEEFWATRNSDLRQNLMRRMRRLEKQSQKLELITLTDPAPVAEAIKAYGRIEAQGWKGREGTALTEDNDQAHFYREVLEHFCERGEGYIYQLFLDGRLIGSEIYIARNGMLVGLKTTFDESLREISPGFLMKYLITREVFNQKKMRVIEFYGAVKDWHAKWSTGFRPMYHVNYFRNSWVRKARELAKRYA